MPEDASRQASAGAGAKGSLPVASFLVAGAGALAAVTWIAHGQVFANAQTGNIVLFCATASQGNWQQALRHIPPMLAFFPGIFAARWLHLRCPAQGPRRAPVVSLCIELAILVAIALLPRRVPDWPITFGIAFVAALQNSAFKHVEGSSYTSVVTTGNLRSAAEAFYAGVFPLRDPAASRKAGVFAAVCAAFAAGAALGAVLTARFGKVAIWASIALLLVALLLCFGEREAAPDATAS